MVKVLIPRINTAIVYLFAIALVYLVVSRFSLNTIIYDMLVFVLVILWGITVLYYARKNKSNIFRVLLLSLVFISILELAYTVKITDIVNNFTRTWHSFYPIKSIEQVSKYGRIEVLMNYFDNFVSSPGTPLVSTIAYLVTALPPIAIYYLYGIAMLVLLLLPSLYLLTKWVTFNIEDAPRSPSPINFLISVLITLSLTIFMRKAFHYFLVGLCIMALLTYYLLISIQPKYTLTTRSRTYLLFTLLILAEAINYLPLAWVYAILVALLGTAILIFSVLTKNQHRYNNTIDAKKLEPFTLIALVAITLYTLYWGFFFCSDLSTAIQLLLEGFKPLDVYVSYTPPRLAKYGTIEIIVIYTNRAHRLLLALVTMISMVTILRYVKNGLVKIITIFATSTLGFAYLSLFVHLPTDYAYRPYVVAMVLLTSQLVTFIAILRRSNRYKRLLHTVMVTLFILSLGPYINNLIIYTQPRYSHDLDYHAYEGYATSLFVIEHIDYSAYKVGYFNVYGDNRYGFLKPLAKIEIATYNNYTISSKILGNEQEGEIILIIPVYNIDFPNEAKYILGKQLFKDLQRRFDVIYNSVLSYIIYKYAYAKTTTR